MSRNRLVLIRHGESMGNYWKPAYHDDRANFLSDIGIKQAEIAGLFLKRHDFNFAYIVTSELTRARQTASTILINMGDWQRHYDIDPNFSEFNQHSNQPFEEHRNKVYSAMDLLFDTWTAGDALCVTHYYTMQRIFDYLQVPRERIDSYQGKHVPNAMPFIYDTNKPDKIELMDPYHHTPQY